MSNLFYIFVCNYQKNNYNVINTVENIEKLKELEDGGIYS